MAQILYPYISEAYVPEHFGYIEQKVETPTGVVNQLILEGEFQRANAQNGNRRIYSYELLNRETNRLRDVIQKQGGIPCGLDHPIPSPTDPPEIQARKIQTISLENACAINIHLEMHNDVVYGKLKAITGDFGNGDKLAALVKNGFKPGISSRGVGGNPLMQNNIMYVPEDYRMICYDVVTNPSTHNAILNRAIMEQYDYFVEHIKEQNRNRKKLYTVLIDITKLK